MGIKIGAKCHHCGTINEMEIGVNGPNQTVNITFACKNCGSLNELCLDLNDPKNPVEDWLCLPPTGFEWALPSGKITPVVGDPIYVSAIGEHMSWQEYVERYRVDPEIAYQYMRRNRNKSADGNRSSDAKRSYDSGRTAKSRTESTKLSPNRIKKAKCGNCGTINEVRLEYLHS